MTDARLDGTTVEVLRTGVPQERIDGTTVQVLRTGVPAARLDGVTVMVLSSVYKGVPPIMSTGFWGLREN